MIPRSVSLVQGNVLRGWQVQAIDKRQTPSTGSHSNTNNISSSSTTIVSAGPAWRVADGVIQAAISRKESGASANLEERLSCQHPLLDGESVSYEYFYEADAWDVSPTPGRVAFLMRLDGVLLHWVTDGQNEWSGLTSDNSLKEPLYRRDPLNLPLKAND